LERKDALLGTLLVKIGKPLYFLGTLTNISFIHVPSGNQA